MKISEFQNLIDLCCKTDNHFIKYTGSAYFIFHFHMIARLDDVFCFQHTDLTPNLEFSFALKFKMRWTKNKLEERDAPDQIILGVMDQGFCAILVIKIHLEHPIHLGGASEDNQSLFGVKKREYQACSTR